MKSPILFSSVFFLLTLASFASDGPKGSAEKIKQDLIQIEREIGRANMECDYRFFDKVEAEEVIFTDANGGLSNKKEDMAGEKDCRKSDNTYTVDEPLVSLYGNTAVVTGRVTISGKKKDGTPLHRQSRFTDVFVWRDQRWQLVAGHSSRTPQPRN